MALHNKRKLLPVVVAILAVAIIVSSLAFLSMQQSISENLEPLTIGMEPNQTNLLIYVAENQNYFRENGLNVTVKSYPSGAAATTAMLNGEINLSSATEFVLARNFLTNDGIQTIGSISKFTHVYLIANKSSGIRDAADLVGKNIGLTLHTNSEFYLGRYLELNNIDGNQLKLTNVPTSQYLDVISNGTVDAVVAWQPYPATIENLLGSDNIAIWDVQSGQPGYEPIIAKSDWISSHPDAIKKFLTSMVQAQDYIAINPSKGQAIAKDHINFTEQYVQATWPNYLFVTSLDQSLLLAMQDEARWLINNNLTNATSVPPFKNCMYTEGLSAVKPQAVNIIG